MINSEYAEALAIADGVVKNGFYWLLGGGVITLGTYASADPGGGYLVFWGPAAYGLLKMYRGYKLKRSIEKLIRNAG